MKDLFTRLWFKFAVEVVVTFLMGFAYYAAKHLIPKKYRIKDNTIKKALKDFNNLSSNIANNDDGIGDVMKKSHNIFEYWFQDRDREVNATVELKTLIADMPDYTVHKSSAFVNSILPKLEQFATTYIVQEIDMSRNIVRMEFNVGGREINFYTIRSSDEKVGLFGGMTTFESVFACPANFHYMKLTNLFFEIFDNRLLFSIKRGDQLSIEKLEQEFNQENYIAPKAVYDDLVNEIMKFKNIGIQRSYILSGPPGTGKTTFCLELSKKISGKIVKLDSKVFTDLQSQDIRGIIEGLDCDFIIVDDIDRIMYNDLSGFFYMLESIKSYEHRPTLLATVNNIRKLDQAVIRPGRFDDIIDFELPTHEERKQFLVNMIEKFNITLTEEDKEVFSKATEGMSQAYLKEYCNQLRIENSMIELVKKITKRRKYLQLDNSSIDDEEEEDMENFGEPESVEDYD